MKVGYVACSSLVVGQIINLKGISRHGKNRINENGSEWEVLSFPSHVGFSNHINCWVKLKSTATNDVRTIKVGGDENFKII